MTALRTLTEKEAKDVRSFFAMGNIWRTPLYLRHINDIIYATKDEIGR